MKLGAKEVIFVGSRGEDDSGNTTRGGGLGTSLGVDPTNLFGQVVAGVDGLNGSIVNVDGVDVSVGVAATASTVSLSHITTSSTGGKWSVGALSGGGQKKKSKAFTQPLWIARKSPSNASDEGEDGSSFRNIMYMMMMQHKSNSKQRERKYQLHQEDMAITCKETHDRRQMMNLLLMKMLNRNGRGGAATSHLVPAPRTLRIQI